MQVYVPGLGPADTVRATARGARVVERTVGPQGTVLITLRPDARDAPGTVDLVVSTRGSVRLDETLAVPVAPPAGRLDVTVEPPVLDGVDRGALVRIRPGPGVPVSDRRLALAASVGSVGPLTRAADGSFTAVYTPPPDLEEPAAVLLAAVDLTAPEEAIGRGVLSIRQPVRRSLDAPPGAETTLSINGEVVGEARADARGLATFDVWLGPGDATGVLRSRAPDGARAQVTVDLDNPARPAIAFVPWPDGTGVPADRPVRLWLAATDAAGAPRDRIPALAVQGVGVEPAVARGDGWHEIVAQAPGEPGPLEVLARLGTVTSALSLRVVPGLPEVSLRAEPEVIGQAEQVVARATYARGRSGRAGPIVRSVDRPDAEPTEDGARIEVAVDGASTRTFVATTSFEPTGLPPARLRLLPGRSWAGEGEPVPLLVVVEDALGVPVPGQSVRLAPHETLIGLPERVDTGADGWALLAFTRSDARVEPIPIGGESGRLRAIAVLWPHVGGLGTAWDAAQRARWARAMPVLTVQRDGPPLGTAVEPPPAGPAAWVPDADEPEPAARTARREPLEIGPLAWSVGVGLADVGIRYAQLSDDAGIPPTTTFRVPLPFGAFGGWVRGEVHHRSGLGLEGFGRFGGYRVILGGQPVRDLAGAWRLGASYRHAFDTRWGLRAGLGYQRTDALALVWDDRELNLLPRTWTLQGARLGAEALARFGPLEARAGLWETFAPGPAITEVTLRADVALPVAIEGLPLSVTAGLDLMFRHLDRTLDAGRVRLDELHGVVLLGVSLGTPPAEAR